MKTHFLIYLLLILIFVFISIISFLIYLLKTKKEDKSELATDSPFVLLQNQMQALTNALDDRVGELRREVLDSNKHIQSSLQQQYGDSSKIIREVYSQLTKLDETNKQVFSVTDQLRDLQDILKNPKQRGVLGEYYLEALLKNVFPPGSFQMQYKFNNGDIVDAVVFVRDKIVPVDSKFSLENYNRMIEEKDLLQKEKLEKEFVNDLKRRIKETAKYIKPDEGTMDFAFMFIPHEAIYYDLLLGRGGGVSDNEESLIYKSAGEYRVIIVSPTSFLAYLQTVLQGLKALQIEESAKEIRKRVGELSRHLNAYDQYLLKLGNTLSTTVNHYNSAYKEFKKIDKDVVRISGEGGDIDPLVLERPNLSD